MNQEQSPVPLTGSYWVIAGQFLAGPSPASFAEVAIHRHLQALLDSGIGVFIDLTEPHELLPYAPWLVAEADRRQVAVAHHRFSIPDRSLPTRAHMAAILNVLDSSISAGKGVYLHCWAGIGRTGTVVGCYLIRHGLAPAASLANIADLRGAALTALDRAPESEEQVEFLLNWQSGE